MASSHDLALPDRAFEPYQPPSGVSRPIALGGATSGIVIGLIAIAGWGFGLSVLTRFFAMRSAMQPVTALCAICIGGAILQLATVRANRLAASILSAFVILAAVQTLLQYVSRIELGTDALLFPVGVASQPITYQHPGRMAAPTASAFLLIGIALMFSQIRGRVSGLILSACATAVLLLVLVALLGYFYMVAPLTGALGFTQVSIPTAIALGGLSLGVLALRPEGGWVSLLIGKSVGAGAARWLIPVVVIVPIAVASLALQGSEAGLYPADFRLAFTTAVTIVLLASLALWGAWQLDRLVAVRRTALTLEENEATLRAFFETEGLFAAIIERHGDEVRYVVANAGYAGLFGQPDISGASVNAVQPDVEADAMVTRLASIEASGLPLVFEQALEAGHEPRWFAITISPIAGDPDDAPRFAIAGFEITGRKRAEAQQELLKLELGHRLKNVLTVVQSVASQTLRQADDLAGANRALSSRLAALGEATNVLTAGSWESADLWSVVDKALTAHGGIGPRIRATGPGITLQPQVTLALALALHELATNAAKYGALSVPSGRVDVTWAVVKGTVDGEPRFRLTWREVGGPEVRVPSRRGFGSTMIERSLAAYFRGEAAIAYPSEGAVFTLDCPLADAGVVVSERDGAK